MDKPLGIECGAVYHRAPVHSDGTIMPVAQFNLARLKHGPDDPRLTSFGIGANMIRRAVESAPGHMWSQQDIIDDVYFATRSVWASVDALHEFVYSGIHRRYLDRSATWFVSDDAVNMVLWSIAVDEQPNLETAAARLELLRTNGPGPEAFDFASAKDYAARV